MLFRKMLWSVIIVIVVFASTAHADSEPPSEPDPKKAPTLPTVPVHGTIIAPNDGFLAPVSVPYYPPGLNPVSSTIPNSGQQETGTKDANSKPCQSSGNPIITSTGNKVETEVDFTSQGEMGLFLRRQYNAFADEIGIFGKYWVSNFDYKITFGGSKITVTCYPLPGGTQCTGVKDPPSQIWAHRPDGRRIVYNYDSASGAWLEDKPTPISRIVKNADGTYTLYAEDHSTERYNDKGYVLELKSEQGIGWTFSYDASNYLQRVTHTSGRYVRFAWNGSQLTSVTDPAGNVYTYTYLANRFGTNINLLASTTLPGSPATTISYFYEDSRFPGALTGKAYNGTRYSWFAYDASGRAISTQHTAGNDKYTLSYTDNADGTTTVVETNPLGKVATYVFKGENLLSVTGTASAHCVATYRELTYDANGYPDLVSDQNGNITDYDYSPAGQLLKKVEASGTAYARTTTYQWDPDVGRNRLLKVTVAGLSETSYAYDAGQRLASVTVKNLSAHGVAGQVHTTTYSYTTNANGLIASVTIDGPLPGTGDAVTYRYDAVGDLTSITNGLGHQTAFSGHNGLGSPGRIVDPNGAITDYTYDARNRVTRV